MKRRITKKSIRASERSLYEGANLYLTHTHDVSCDKCEEIFKGLICVALMLLLNFKDQLGSGPRAHRWVNDIVLSALTVVGSTSLSAQGVVTWGVEGGPEINEPLHLSVHLNKSRHRRSTYSLALGTTPPLAV